MRNKKKTPLIILATYWNERYFIEPSLRQIEALNPAEIIISEGCFNPKVTNHSTDGTREVIQKFVKKHPNARLISAQRPGFFHSLWFLLRGHTHLPWWTMFRPVRWKFFLRSINRIAYERNEMITFNHMISISQAWKPGIWFMTCDADQFYSDEMIEKIKEALQRDVSAYWLMTGKERTFFADFHHYTDTFEKRIFNNMPHRIFEDTLIQPTRSLIRETKSGGFPFSDIRHTLAKHLYVYFAPSFQVGVYYHYKLNSPERFEAGYQLGDRKKPDVSQYTINKFEGKHPRVIREHFGV